ncbi:MAG: class I SAM-dependent methyltransferase [Chloroflexi bacterium]|nr:class I SAM-dependent methyltransferase [Chloroflexota bacterium]
MSRSAVPFRVGESGERIWGERPVSRRNMALRRALVSLESCRGAVLEVGCGAGRFIASVQALRPDLEAHGCDLSPRAIAGARAAGTPVRFAVASLTALPYATAAFDAVLLFDVLEHLREPALGLAEIHRVLRPCGVFHALVPCEGQPCTLHWLLWRLGVAADLKERHGEHVQRFTRAGVGRLLAEAGFQVERVEYSMHPAGQVRDVLVYLALEPWFRRLRLDNPLYRVVMRALWAAAYVESTALRAVPNGAVVVHATARRMNRCR